MQLQAKKEDAPTFGENVQRAREGKEWSQEELAKRIGASNRTVVRYEKRVSPPKERHITEKIAAATGVPLSFLDPSAEGEAAKKENSGPSSDTEGPLFEKEKKEPSSSVYAYQRRKRSSHAAARAKHRELDRRTSVELGKMRGTEVNVERLEVTGITVHLDKRERGFRITINEISVDFRLLTGDEDAASPGAPQETGEVGDTSDLATEAGAS